MKKILIGALATSLIGVTAVSVPVQAAVKGKPNKPVITIVNQTVVSKKSVRITVTVEAPPADKGPILETKVIFTYLPKDFSCSIKGKSKSCSAVISGDYEMQIHARSRTASGFGPTTKIESWRSRGEQLWIHKGYDALGVKFPAPKRGIGGTKILGTAIKWSKFETFKNNSVSKAGLRQSRFPTVNGDLVVFQVSGIVGIGLAVGSSFGVDSNGTTTGLFATGSATPAIQDIYAGPNNKFYIVFAAPTLLRSGDPTCAFVELNTDTGIPICVDSSIASVATTVGSQFGYQVISNSGIQFDNTGAVYYLGTSKGSIRPASIRKKAGEVITDLFNDNMAVRDYLVLTDGTLIVAGLTLSSQAYWIRKILPDGSISNLTIGSNQSFMKLFPDGNVYVGNAKSQGGVYRYITAAGTLDSNPWINSGYSGAVGTPTFDTTNVCFSDGPSSYSQLEGFCSNFGSNARAFFKTGENKIFAIVGMKGGASSVLMQYYPILSRPNSTVRNATVWLQVGEKIVIAGTDSAGKNQLNLYDSQSGQETLLFSVGTEIEIYNMGYVASTNKILFNGLNFTDGKTIVGDVTLP